MNIWTALGEIAWHIYPLVLLYGCWRYFTIRPNGLLLGSYLSTALASIMGIWVKKWFDMDTFDAGLNTLYWGLLAAPIVAVLMLVGFRRHLRTVEDYKIRSAFNGFVIFMLANLVLFWQGTLLLVSADSSVPDYSIAAFINVVFGSLPGGTDPFEGYGHIAVNVCVAIAVVSYAIGFLRAKPGPILHVKLKKDPDAAPTEQTA